MKKRSYTPADVNIGFVGAILRGLVAPTTAEPGVELFMPYRSPNNPARFSLYELHVDVSGRQQHQETTHFKAAIAELLPRTAARERVPFIPNFESLDQF